MEVTNNKISQSQKFVAEYEILLQKVKYKFCVKDCVYIGISKSKASRVLNGLQFDVLTLIEMASFVGYTTELFFKKRTNLD